MERRPVERVKRYKRRDYRRKNGTRVHSAEVPAHLSHENAAVYRRHEKRVRELLAMNQRDLMKTLARMKPSAVRHLRKHMRRR